MVQDPAKRENLDAYDLLAAPGDIKGPLPVMVQTEVNAKNADELEKYLFDWDEVALERVPALVREAMARTKLEGGKVDGVRVAMAFPSSDEMAKMMDDEIHARMVEIKRKIEGRPAR